MQNNKQSLSIADARTASLCEYRLAWNCGRAESAADQFSLECVKILCEHYKISSAALRPPTQYQAFLLLFTRLVQLVTSFFLR